MAKSDALPESDKSTADVAWMIVSYLIGGIVFYGGIGWLLSLKFGHWEAFVAVGVIVGIALSLYLVHYRVSNSDNPTPKQ